MIRPCAGVAALTDAERQGLPPLLAAFDLAPAVPVLRYVDERFGKHYDAYRVTEGHRVVVLKRDDGEDAAYGRWLDGRDDLPVARRLATGMVGGERWHLLDHVGDADLQDLGEARVPLAAGAGAAVARLHATFWEAPADRQEVDAWLHGWATRFAAVTARVPELTAPMSELIARLQSSPITVTHQDLLPMNLLWDGDAVRLIDFGSARIGPYFMDPARFVAFGREGGLYRQAPVCREAFVAAYYDELSSTIESAPEPARFQRDLLLGELFEWLACLSSTLGRQQRAAPGEALPDAAIDEDRAGALRVAAELS